MTLGVAIQSMMSIGVKSGKKIQEQIMQLGGTPKIVSKQETQQVQDTQPEQTTEQTPTKNETSDFSSNW